MLFLLGDFGTLDKSQYPSSKGIRSLRHAQHTQPIGGSRIRERTREGMAVAKAKGRLRGKKPKLTPRQEAHLVSLARAGEHTTLELAELFNVGRSTVYRAIQRAGGLNPTAVTDG